MAISLGSVLAQVKVLIMFILSWGGVNRNVTPPHPHRQPPEVQTGAEPQVPCYFVFGDSLSDSGNNNNLPTQAKANYVPYGIDWPDSFATGRFTNNKTFVDVLTQLLGFDHFIPSFNRSMGVDEASQGVNYASGGAGILYETGRRNLGEVISFYQQIQNHRTIVDKIGDQVNLTECLYTINIGNNDYINNYFNNGSYITSKIYTPTQFASILTKYYGAYVKILHGLGARKIAFYLLTQIGCSLGEMANFNTTSCVEVVDDAVAIFNGKLVPLITELNETLSGAQFIYINSSAVETSSYISAGITVYDKSCCETRSDGQCQSNATVCSDRDVYYFWDYYHPTNAVVEVLGAKAYKADENTTQAVPYDISTLVRL